ncbi:hypothetical protein EV426DRAFT_197287 [Tirmania nivea]|nr:hypothetical protein EV426DRAFT_197287 [Tirmania nivea]
MTSWQHGQHSTGRRKRKKSTKSTRPGPKGKSTALQPRSVNSLNRRLRSSRRKSYTREFKLKALSMLQKSRIDPETGAKIPASIKWVSQELKITKKMLLRWRAQEAKIVAARKGSRQVERPPKGVWHEMEAALHTRFIAIRKQGKPVGQRWFIRE